MILLILLPFSLQVFARYHRFLLNRHRIASEGGGSVLLGADLDLHSLYYLRTEWGSKTLNNDDV